MRQTGLRYAVATLLALVVACDAHDTGTATQTDVVAPDALPTDDSAILLEPNTIAIVGMPGVGAMQSGTVTGLGTVTELAAIELVDPNVPGVFQVIDPPCPTGSCAFAPGSQPLPRTIDIACTPEAGVVRTASITVRAPDGKEDVSQLSCSSTATGPALQVPSTVGPITSLVGETVPTSLVITNSGDVDVDISLVVPAGAGSAAAGVAPDTCTIGVGTDLEVMLAFTPPAHGAQDATLQITSTPNAGTKFVTLLGTGVGGVLRVDDPPEPAFAINFGTIAKNQLATATVVMTNLGNADLTVSPSSPGAPFIVPAAAITVPGNSGVASFPVSCMSANAGGPFDRTIDLSPSPNTYSANTTTIAVRCAIANTNVTVTPNPVAMGDLQVGDPPSTVTVMIENPGAASIVVEDIRLAEAPPELTLGMPSLALPATVPARGMMTVPVELATTADVTLDDVLLEVVVVEGGATTALQIPVTGTVGTPSALVAPDRLELGTVCVGTPVTGTITMTNDGTATLTAQPPTMSSTAFTALFVSPTDYPTELLPGMTATIGVSPATSEAGRIEATLEWDVDVPLAPFQVPIALELIASGTAVSPSRLVFGTHEITAPSPPQTITLENCGPEPAVVTYSGVTASSGATSAWQLSPPADQRTLLPDETMQIMVTFAPTRPGAHVATLDLDLGGQPRAVALEGDAIGDARDKTGFYGCSCAGGGAPSRGWPLGLALVLVLRRRRRC